MISYRPVALFIALLSPMLFQAAYCEEKVFALIPKYMETAFYLSSKDGCMAGAAELSDVRCVYAGPRNYSDVRVQNEIINKLIENGVDGIAIAVTNSEFLSTYSLLEAKNKGIPVITYDADLEEKHQHLRMAYIGTDNVALGEALGQAAIRLRPQGGQICIFSGRKDSPNLNLRIQGIRAMLNNHAASWKEINRCPLFNNGDSELALHQLKSMLLGDDSLNTIISVGGGAQNMEDEYRELMESVNKKITQNRVSIIWSDASATQISYLRDGYSDINVGQRPYDMGYIAIKTLHKIVTKRAFDPLIHTPLSICDQNNFARCTR